MKCLSCKTENQEGVVYCQNCGAYLPLDQSREYFDIIKALLLGVTFTVLFYLFYLPVTENYYIKQLFLGSISQAILGLTTWSLFLVGFKYLRYREQSKAFRVFRHQQMGQILEQGVYVKTTEDRLHEISTFLREQSIKRYQNSWIFRRVRRIFNQIQAIPKKEEINKIFDYQAQLDFNRMENGYSLLNVFIWAIPILGFIGTVFGIGEAIGEFSSFIRSVSTVELGGQMRSALGGVTSGLSVAFNTTFLALVFVIPIMVLSSFLRKIEEDLLLQIEEYCLEEILPHLHIIPGSEVEREAFDEHMQKIMHLSGNWMARLEPLIESITHYSGGLKYQIEGLQPLVKEFSNSLFSAKDQSSPQDSPGETEPKTVEETIEKSIETKSETVEEVDQVAPPASKTGEDPVTTDSPSTEPRTFQEIPEEPAPVAPIVETTDAPSSLPPVQEQTNAPVVEENSNDPAASESVTEPSIAAVVPSSQEPSSTVSETEGSSITEIDNEVPRYAQATLFGGTELMTEDGETTEVAPAAPLEGDTRLKKPEGDA